MGIGGVPVASAAVALIAANAPRAAFARDLGEETAIGRVGSLLATAPFAWLAAYAGWRGGFWVLAAVVLVLGLGVLLLLRVPHSGATPVPERPDQVLSGLFAALRAPSFWPLMLFQSAMMGVCMVLLSAWGAPWLCASYGWSLVGAGNALTTLAVGYVGGAVLWGVVPRWTTRHRQALLVGGLVMLALLAVPAAALLSRDLALPWLGAAGLLSGCYPLVLTQLKEALPTPLAARVTGLLNLGMMGVSALLLAGSGLVVDLHGGTPGARPATAFPDLFVLLGAVLTLAMVWTLTDSLRRRRQRSRQGTSTVA
jgi:hypothetical protein